jgi:hypothetical protein
MNSPRSSEGITFDDSNPNTPFIREFLISKLNRTLLDFECSEFESSRFIQWFYTVCRFWPEKKSQEDFDRYARERLSDKVGYTRRRADAFKIIDQYFDKGDLLNFDDIVAAVHFCAKPEKIPHGVFHNGDAAIVDLPKQPKQKKDRLLKVDATFWPTLELLYPWSRVEDTIIKLVPMGSTVREFDLVKLAFWFKYRNANRDERDRALAFHNADPLDWTDKNLYSRWREGRFAERFANRVDPLPVDSGVIPTFDARYGKLVDGKWMPPTAHSCPPVAWVKTKSTSRVTPVDDGMLEALTTPWEP